MNLPMAVPVKPIIDDRETLDPAAYGWFVFYYGRQSGAALTDSI